MGHLQDLHVSTWFPLSERVATCLDSATWATLAMIRREHRSGLFTLQIASPHLAASSQVVASCSCRPLFHPIVQWHHRLSHPSLPCLRCISSQRLVSGLPRAFASLPPPMPPCTPCVEGRLPLAAPCCYLPCSLCCQAPACPACCAAMATLRVLAFDHEGCPIQFDTWLDDLQLYLLSDSRDSASLFDHTSGAAPAPPATADSVTHSQWLTRDAAARLAIRNHLPLAECAHFGQHRSAQALYDTVVARYSSPATAALGRLLLPYLFPKLSAFATVEDLVLLVALLECPSLRGVPPPPLPPPTPLLLQLTSLVLRTSGLLLLVRRAATARARVVAVAAGVVVGAAVEVVEAVEVVAVVGVVARVGALVAAVVAAVGEAVVAAVGMVAVGMELLSVEVLAVARGSTSSVGARPRRPSSFVSGFLCVGRLGTCGKPHTQHRCFSRLDDSWHAEFGDEAERPRWAELLRSGVAIFDLDYDAILAAMYALSVSAKGGSRCFFRDSTTLTPLSAPVPVRLADPFGGPVLARSSTVLPCLTVPSGSSSGLHLPLFSTNLVGTAALQDAMVTTTTPGGQRVSICTCTRTGRHLATFTHRLGSSLYTLATEPPQVATSAQVSASGPVASPCSCRLLSHQTLMWHHHLGHPSLPRLRGMQSRLLLFGLPRTLPPLPPSPAPPCLPCVEGRQRAAPHSSSFPSTTAPLQTLHMDRFRQDLPVLPLHFDRGGEFSSDLLREFCREEGIFQAFRLPASPQKNGIAERRIGLVMEVARTSMIYAAAPIFCGRLRFGFGSLLPSLPLPLCPSPTEPGAAGARGACARGTAAGGAGAVDPGAGGAGAGGAVSGGTGAGGTVRPRPYFVPLLQQVFGVPSSCYSLEST
ncbi:unnamed protein product [Closterium sp. NIES-54]